MGAGDRVGEGGMMVCGRRVRPRVDKSVLRYSRTIVREAGRRREYCWDIKIGNTRQSGLAAL